jgi:hypothetical protein
MFSIQVREHFEQKKQTLTHDKYIAVCRSPSFSIRRGLRKEAGRQENSGRPASYASTFFPLRSHPFESHQSSRGINTATNPPILAASSKIRVAGMKLRPISR